ncbi:SDR family oxidoreductase [Haloferula chungangensis]|uniref:SDR family oxidoreductase n=1 Tax=Haloferula chungangensis TaxID=1048331 RepID=A0ABW2L3V9_9BACT
MHLLVTGANGYIGLRLIPALLEAGHRVTALVRDRRRFPLDDFSSAGDRLQLLEGDFLEPDTLPEFPNDVDVAYYLLHSMGGGGDFVEREKRVAAHFVAALDPTRCQRTIYLSGLTDPNQELSPHLRSRNEVEDLLRSARASLTVLRASIIVGSGSASFEIVRDLGEKLPVMICPRWVATRCQPIAIRNVIEYLTGLLDHPTTASKTYDIGGPEILRYRDLLEGYAEVRGLKRYFIPVPFLSPGLSSWWLYLMTSTTFSLARALVHSMKNETICQDHAIRSIIPLSLLSYRDAVELALARIAQNRVPSRWADSLQAGTLDPGFIDAVRTPEHGVFIDQQTLPITSTRKEAIEAVWSLGGRNGWPSMNWAWRIRGALDRIFGGTGIRRGRRHPSELRPGDPLDFWRVIVADRKAGRLMLYAEMKLPGEAWLEFRIEDDQLKQTATFRPQGIFGRLYWFAVLPFHWLLFPLMARRLAGASR